MQKQLKSIYYNPKLVNTYFPEKRFAERDCKSLFYILFMIFVRLLVVLIHGSLLIARSKVMKNAIENKTANDARWNFLARKIRIKRNHITISNLEFLLLIRVTPFCLYVLL